MADQPPSPGTPRWVKVSLMVVVVLALVFVILNLAGVGGGPGGHGPGRHMPPNGLGDGTPPSSVT